MAGWTPQGLSWRALELLLEHRESTDQRLPVNVSDPPRNACLKSLEARGLIRYVEGRRRTTITRYGAEQYRQAMQVWDELLSREEEAAKRIEELKAEIAALKAKAA